ncbi:hypothetical protein [Plebeiibacterium sediminum]|uniref:Uncharacterized protein n=1 Tax=Plebeiibacterium sediminum TaxID=2992112 RepID=A0AAE3M4L3_9BACT|nr:hypothetical protein [Plebeiobacterium sediminum]MCW3786747.1 hypothetical protein [Plebeiobacterium sediminum]
MRKIAAHFILHPDGSVGKFPVIVFDQDGTIVEIRERSSFIEEPSLELVNGFLCPGFVDFFRTAILQNESVEIQKYINRQVISGIKVLGASEDDYSDIIKYRTRGISFTKTSNKCSMLNNEYNSLFDFLKFNKSGVDSLMRYTIENASILEVNDQYGSLEVGKRPGIIAISGMNYETMRLTGSAKIKLIV